MLPNICGKKSQSVRSKSGRKWAGEVKLSVTNPLRQALARCHNAGPHPDAGVLTALAEGSLLQRERQQLLAHLADCADCREILGAAAGAALSSAEDLNPFVPTRPLRPAQREWLPWGSLAAGLVIACAAVLFYQNKPAVQKNTEMANKEAVQLPAPTLQRAQPTPSLAMNGTLGKTVDRQAAKPLQAPLRSRKMYANVAQEDQVQSAKNSGFSLGSSYLPSAEAGAVAPSSAPALKAAPAPSASAFVNATTERALTSASMTAAARPHWRINSAGRPERSFDDGAWQAVLPNEPSKMRVVSVFDGEVWIGGDNSRLYHSIDNGTTWTLVALPEKDGPEHSIAHIRFQTAQSGTVESEDGTVWTTSDGGSTWK